MLISYDIAADYRQDLESIQSLITDFEAHEHLLGPGERNQIKKAILGKKEVVIKSFKVPHLFNSIVYRFFRMSKAERSFNYALKLRERNIGTPEPVAFFCYGNGLLFRRSYYICEHLKYDLTYRELTENHDYPDHNNILRAFTRFTFNLHEQEVEFLDHSPGNTLIKKSTDGYEFFLVDLNRMRFGSLSFEERIRNFSRLSPHKSIVKIMSDEYAKCLGEKPDKVFELMWQFTSEFQEKYWRKQRMKRRIKFWKK